MVLYSHKRIELLDYSIPSIKLDDHFFEDGVDGNYSCFNSDDYDNNSIMTKGYANSYVAKLQIIINNSAC